MFSSLIFLNLICFTANQEIFIEFKEHHHVYNKSGVGCVWCSLESLGKLHKIDRLDGLTITHRHPSTEWEALNLLKTRNVPFEVGRTGEYLKKKLREGYPCAVFIKVNERWSHCLIICGYTNKEFWVVDNSDEEFCYRSCSFSHFDSVFAGVVITIWKP